MKPPRGLLGFILVIQFILLVTHFFLYETWAFSLSEAGRAPALWFKILVAALSVSFIAASLLAFRYTNPILRAFYRVAAVWLGLLSFLFFAAIFSWTVFGLAALSGVPLNFHFTVETLFATALVIGFAAVFNASWTRVERVKVKLANLPESWRGRTAALVSDLHLGHVRNGSFLRRIVAKLMQEKPDVIFVAGDLYDGTAIDAAKAAEPLRKLTAPHGTYFVAGNHEQFGDDSKYIDGVAAAGLRVMTNEKVEVDGLQIIGVPYRHATHDAHLTSVLKEIGVDQDRASILLTHAPDRPHIAEAAGISLQLSGHTHVGQFYPWSWMARRVYRQFVYGLSRIGRMQIYTSSGVGTWGPPLRLGSNPEIVMLQFE
jgi:predicted MPP superfamily phosphohydrolase